MSYSGKPDGPRVSSTKTTTATAKTTTAVTTAAKAILAASVDLLFCFLVLVYASIKSQIVCNNQLIAI